MNNTDPVRGRFVEYLLRQVNGKPTGLNNGAFLERLGKGLLETEKFQIFLTKYQIMLVG